MDQNNIQTDVATRTPISWRGKEVPWITRWTGEIPDEVERVLRPSWDGNALWLFQPARPDGEREANGFLWQAEGIKRGGRPQFAQVSTYRQRTAMRKRLCQVCGKKITTPVINWLFGANQIEIGPGGELLTVNAPTCDACIPIARDLCPHLRENQGGKIVRVLEYELWGVLGEAVRVVLKGGVPFIEHDPPGMLPYQPAPEATPEGYYPTAVLAKQQVVILTKYQPLDLT